MEKVPRKSKGGLQVFTNDRLLTVRIIVIPRGKNPISIERLANASQMVLRVKIICAARSNDQAFSLRVEAFCHICPGSVSLLADCAAAPEEVLIADIRSIVLFHDAHP